MCTQSNIASSACLAMLLHSNAFSHVFPTLLKWSVGNWLQIRFSQAYLGPPLPSCKDYLSDEVQQKQHGGSSRHDIEPAWWGTTPAARGLMVGDWHFSDHVRVCISKGHCDKDTEWIWMTQWHWVILNDIIYIDMMVSKSRRGQGSHLVSWLRWAPPVAEHAVQSLSNASSAEFLGMTFMVQKDGFRPWKPYADIGSLGGTFEIDECLLLPRMVIMFTLN